MTTYFLWALLQRLPVLLVILAGIVFSLLRWKRHPKASLITVIALVFYFFKFFAFTALNYWLPILRESMQWSYATADNLYTVVQVVNDFCFAMVLVLLVAAVYVGRRPMTVPNI
jgi:hypothetical protein